MILITTFLPTRRTGRNTADHALERVEDLMGIRHRWTGGRLEALGIAEKGPPDQLSTHITVGIEGLDFPELARSSR